MTAKQEKGFQFFFFRSLIWSTVDILFFNKDIPCLERVEGGRTRLSKSGKTGTDSLFLFLHELKMNNELPWVQFCEQIGKNQLHILF